jgi:hypothetical protein
MYHIAWKGGACYLRGWPPDPRPIVLRWAVRKSEAALFTLNQAQRVYQEMAADPSKVISGHGYNPMQFVSIVDEHDIMVPFDGVVLEV